MKQIADKPKHIISEVVPGEVVLVKAREEELFDGRYNYIYYATEGVKEARLHHTIKSISPMNIPASGWAVTVAALLIIGPKER